ncbi:hypothetical protein PR202_ga27905 [Eleusine coracana subsp. coracana]|uniref:Uncharacterized protein n=1 Tax=Eleusine coracana subsp. coracana TaxID=191504 RepID=A0AAV5DHQ3_ELECO|nr:hypothetical protein PR202_ga27905 [Eleusine coracana subsp. coracana]
MHNSGRRLLLHSLQQQQQQHYTPPNRPAATMQVRMMATSSSVLLLLVLWFLAGAMAGEAVQFRVVIQNTETHENFDREVGVEFAGMVLAKATELAWQTLGQHSTSDRKKFDEVTLLVEGDMYHGTFTSASTIHLGGGLGTDNMHNERRTFDRLEVAGILYREVTNEWQFDGNGHANKGLLGGIAELVQMRSGYTPSRWAKKGDGLVAELGRKMNKGYNDRFFADITGKTVSQLWKEYKASNKNTI